ncbi:MAG: tetratricopeptide repeat protein [Acidobacteriota bacterium]
MSWLLLRPEIPPADAAVGLRAAFRAFGRSVGCLALGLAVSFAGSAPLQAQGGGDLAAVEAAIEAGDGARALDLLAARGRSLGARELMLRGTAKLIVGELRGGAADLEAAVERDPSLRQGWMNLAGLEIAEGDWPEAHRLLRKAHDLDPSAPDGQLNLGAVLVMMGRGAEAAEHFGRYLEVTGGGGEEHYLVATNYALGGAEHLAIEHLEQAFARDERLRLRARRDDRFLGLDSLEYRVLLSTDAWTAPADWHDGAAAFRRRYQRDDGVLLYAVLDTLRALDVPYGGDVEATARWALVWGQGGLRIKLFNQDDGTSVVQAVAPPASFSGAQWQRFTQELFRGVHGRLATARPPVPRLPNRQAPSSQAPSSQVPSSHAPLSQAPSFQNRPSQTPKPPQETPFQ